MTERGEGNVHLPPEDTQGRGWFTNRHGVDEGRSVMTGITPRADQPQSLDNPFADPKFTGNGATWPGFEK